MEIQIKNLTKTYGEVKALNNLNVTFRNGKIISITDFY